MKKSIPRLFKVIINVTGITNQALNYGRKIQYLLISSFFTKVSVEFCELDF